MRLRLSTMMAAAALACGPGVLAAQVAQERVLAVVDYLAGESLYLAAGSDQGLAAGDTISLFPTEDGPAMGRVAVASVTRRRAVVSWVGPSVTVNQGDIVYLGIPRPASIPASGTTEAGAEEREGGEGVPPEAPPPPSASLVEVSSSTVAPGPTASGRLGVELGLTRSTTTWDGWEDVDRSFATPVLRLTTVVTHLPGGLTFRANARGSYRYSDPVSISSELSGRVYQLSLAKRFDSIPLEFMLGRFSNPYERYSGYWDGAMVRIGGSRVGVGGVVGWDPRYSDEAFSSDVPKASGWFDVDLRGADWRYGTDLSLHRMSPSNGLREHTFAGWSQDVRIGRFNLYNRIQVDRRPADGGWDVSRLQGGLSVAVSRAVTIRGYYASREPYSIWRDEDEDPFLPRRDRGSAGVTLAGRSGTLTLDGGAQRLEDEEWAPSGSMSFALSPSLTGRWGLYGSGSYWRREDRQGFILSPGVTRQFGPSRFRAGYHFYSTSEPRLEIRTHGGDLSLDVPLAQRVRSSVRLLGQWGENTRSLRLRLALWVPF